MLLVGALDLQRAGHDAAQIADPRPFLDQRRIRASPRGTSARTVRDARCAARVAMAREPGLFRGEAQDRREPGDQAVEERGRAPCARRGGATRRRVAIERSPCGCRNRRPRDRWRRNCSSAANTRVKSKLSIGRAHHADRARPAGAAPSAPAPASAVDADPLGLRRTRRARPADSARCCAAGDRHRLWCFRISGPMRRSSVIVRARPPTAAGCRRRSAAMTSCGATMLPSDFDILRPCSSSTKPWVSTAS